MQGRNSSICLVADKMETFKARLSPLEERVKDKRLDISPLLSEKL